MSAKKNPNAKKNSRGKCLGNKWGKEAFQIDWTVKTEKLIPEVKREVKGEDGFEITVIYILCENSHYKL